MFCPTAVAACSNEHNPLWVVKNQEMDPLWVVKNQEMDRTAEASSYKMIKGKRRRS